MKQRCLSSVLSLVILLFCALPAQGQAAAAGEAALSEEGGSILAHYAQGKAIPDEERVQALYEEMEKLLAKVEGKNDVSKVVILHDLLIQGTEMDFVAAARGTPTTAYDALVETRPRTMATRKRCICCIPRQM